jgi:hypothetical protein
MSKMKNLSEYLSGTCVFYHGCDPFPDEDPFPTADYLTYETRDGKTFIKQYCNGCEEQEEYEVTPGKDFIYIGECPHDEDPFHKYPSSRICQALIIQLRNTYGREPDGARLYAKFERGADGYEVCCEYHNEKPLSFAYALMLESNLPERWSPAAKRYLEGGDS